MKRTILLLLMLSVAFSVDLERIGTHTVDGNLTNTVNYVDYFYGTYANNTEGIIGAYPSELDYIRSRSGPVIVSRWSITKTGSVLMVNVTGVYPGCFAGFINQFLNIYGLFGYVVRGGMFGVDESCVWIEAMDTLPVSLCLGFAFTAGQHFRHDVVGFQAIWEFVEHAAGSLCGFSLLSGFGVNVC